jgi:hypothetical protein
MNNIFIYILLIFMSLSVNSNAYLGPGLGGGIIAASLGIIFAIFSLLFAIIWFPIKRLLKKKRGKKKSKNRYK